MRKKLEDFPFLQYGLVPRRIMISRLFITSVPEKERKYMAGDCMEVPNGKLERNMLKLMPEEKDAARFCSMENRIWKLRKITSHVAEIVKFATGFESNSDLLKDRLVFSKDDIEKFLKML